MTPSGMLTIPEALKIISARIDDDDLLVQRKPKPTREEIARESLAGAILNKKVAIYTVRGGALHEIQNHLDYDTWKSGIDVQEAMEGWEAWLSDGRVNNGGKYDGCRLFIRPFSLRHWLGPDPEELHLTRTGAAGRPSPMYAFSNGRISATKPSGRNQIVAGGRGEGFGRMATKDASWFAAGQAEDNSE